MTLPVPSHSNWTYHCRVNCFERESYKVSSRRVARRQWRDALPTRNMGSPFIVAISILSSTLAVCESYGADIRAGRHRPHQRHWQALAGLVGMSPVV
jgi:hypothetical protein